MRYTIAVTLLATLAYAEEKWQPSELCPFPSNEQIRSKYEGDCSKYWECYQGARYTMSCQQGLEYNDVKHRIYVVVYPIYPHDPYDPDAPQEKWQPDIRCPFPSDELTRTKYQGDCERYWECYQGARYTMWCPQGLEYNDVEHRCDAPEIAKCDPDAPVVYPIYPHEPYNPDEPRNPEDPGNDGVPDPLCPYPSHDLVFFPDPTDCTKYLECYDGKRYRMSCPASLYWNDVSNYCDYLENVKCDRTPVNPDIPDDSQPEPEDPSGDLIPDPVCPSSSRDLIFYPDPNDCTKYLECYDGTQYRMSCPATLYWNDVTNNCDYLENVNCNRVPHVPDSPDTPEDPQPGLDAPEDPQPGPDAPENPDEPQPEPENPSGDWAPDPLCPFPSHDLYFFPDPTDCSKYLECYEGNKFRMSCPSNLYWNELTNSCDYLENVKCDRTPDSPDAPDAPDAPDTPDDPQPGTAFAFESDLSFNTCPDAPDTPEDPEPGPDAPDTPEDQEPAPGPDAPEDTDPAPAPDAPDSPDTPEDPDPAPVTLCLNQPDGTYLANPNDCMAYYDCVRGEAVPFRCGIGLRWNQDILNCDYTANVKC
ncbi:hypothetical protein NQ314_001105 [Rhamnusium bicolor]|uniref:Chitin-binding type-2 domain-containing protein n=1 Tax=Rhamnusium bicolor TaxID=1586634 RepID=A0AAV8ZT25_9CUCU|nr:hypothetical protein NQ314_001105 [Rhamnusium bicolor]